MCVSVWEASNSGNGGGVMCMQCVCRRGGGETCV